MRLPLRLIAATFLASHGVAAPPENDNRANAIALATGVRAYAILLESTVEADEPIPPDYNPATWQNSVWYSWTAPPTGGWHLMESTALSVAVWRLEPGGALVPIHAARMTEPDGVRTMRFPAEPAASYRIALTSEDVSRAGKPADIRIIPVPSPSVMVSSANVEPDTIESAASAREVKMTFTLAHTEPLLAAPDVELVPEWSRRPLEENHLYFDSGLEVGYEPSIPAQDSGAELVSASPKGSTWCATFRIPPGIPPGSWRPSIGWLATGRADWDRVAAGAGPLRSMPMTGTTENLTVFNSGAADTDAPVVVSAAIIRDDFNTQGRNGTLQLKLRDPAGVPVWRMEFRDPETGMMLHDGSSSRVEGDDLILTLSVYHMGFSSAGSYRLEVTAWDTFGNKLVARSTDAGFPGPFTGLLPLNGVAAAELLSVSFSPPAVDVSNADATVTATFRIRAARSDTAPGSVTLTSAASRTYGTSATADMRVTGDFHDSTWQVPVVIPRGAYPGPMKVRISNEYHVGGASTTESDWAEGYRRLPDFVPPVIVNHGPVDLEGPEVTALSVAPAAFDLTLPEPTQGTFVVSMDDLSGAGVRGTFLSGITGDRPVDWYPRHGDVERTAGTDVSGTWTGTMRLDEEMPPGNYQVSIYVGDRHGNWTLIDSSEQGGPGAVPMMATVQNFAPPTAAVTFSPPVIDVTTAPATVEVLLDINAPGIVDNSFDVGVRGGLVLPGDTRWPSYYDIQFVRISGTPANGRWKGVQIVPGGIPPGPRLLYLSVNQRGPDFTGFVPGSLTIVNDGPVDRQPPVLTSLDIDPATVDVRSGDRAVTVRVSAIDDASGIADGYVSGPGFHLSLTEANRVAGNSNSGTWEDTVVITRDTSAASHEVVCELRDGAQKSASYYSTDPAFPGPFRGNFSVHNRQRPVLTELVMTPETVDVSFAPQTVLVGFTARVPGAFQSAILKRSTHVGPETSAFQRTGGTDLEGTWEAPLVIPRGLPPGPLDFDLSIAGMEGPTGNYSVRSYIPGAQHTIHIVNTGPVDTAAPQLTAFSSTITRSPGLAGPGLAEIALEVNDDISGVHSVTVYGLAAVPDGPRWRVTVPVHAGAQTVNVSFWDKAGNVDSILRTIDVPAPPQPYVHWLSHYGLPATTDPLSDSDGDGIVDLLECAFGTSPVSGEHRREAIGPYPASPFGVQSLTHHGLPVVSRDINGVLAARWWMPYEAQSLGLRYSAEVSTDLMHWEPATLPVHIPVEYRSENHRVWARAADFASAAAAKWIRLRVELLPGAR